MWCHIRLHEACNLACAFCYAQHNNRLSQLSVAQFKEILSHIQQLKGERMHTLVLYLSGGEPLLHPDFPVMLEYAAARADRINILTNGILLGQHIDQIRSLSRRVCVQISLDGDQATNDNLRGEGTFQYAVEALRCLKASGVRHWISYTVSELNRHCYPAILDIAKETDSYYNNISPYTGNPDHMLAFSAWQQFKAELLSYAQKINLPNPHSLSSCGFEWVCGAGLNGLTVNPDMTVTGCARDDAHRVPLARMTELLHDQCIPIHYACMREKWKHDFPQPPQSLTARCVQALKRIL